MNVDVCVCACTHICMYAIMYVCICMLVHMTQKTAVFLVVVQVRFSLKKTTQLSHGKILSWINKVYSAIHKECVAHQKFKIKPVFSEQLMHT